MSGKYDYNEVEEMQVFLVKLGVAFDKSMADDGKLSMGDMGNFMAPLMAAGDAFGGLDKIPQQIGDLDASELAALQARFNSDFDIANDKVEVLVEKGLKLGLAFVDYMLEVKNAVKKEA